MKKVIIAVGFLISFVLIGLGVYGFILNKQENEPINKDEKNSLEVLKYSFETLKSTNNFSDEVSVVTNKEEENIIVISKIDLDTKQSEISMTINGVLATHSYTVLENGNLVNYISVPAFGTEGFLRTTETEETSSSLSIDRTRFEILTNNINLFEVKDNNMFVATIPREIASNVFFNIDEDSDELEVIGDVQLVVTLSNNNIEKITYDYSNVIKSGEEIYTKYIITEKYYDIGSTIISVPEEVKNSVISG